MVVKYEGKETIEGKAVIITGANTGIGKETARDLARRGGRIIMACRDLEKADQARKEIVEDTKNEDVLVRELDLSSFESIQNFAKNFNETEPRLDILINNAGVLTCERMLTKDGLEMQIGVNHFGHFLLTGLLLDKLKASTPSRIINVSSVAHRRGSIKFDDLNSEKSYHYLDCYDQSKLANVLHALELSKRLEGTGVTVNSLHPGYLATDLQRYLKVGWRKLFIVPICKLFFDTPEKGIHTTLYCSLHPALGKVSGKYFSDCKEETPSSNAQNEEDAKRLWDLTEEIIQQKLGAHSE